MPRERGPPPSRRRRRGAQRGRFGPQRGWRGLPETGTGTGAGAPQAPPGCNQAAPGPGSGPLHSARWPRRAGVPAGLGRGRARPQPLAAGPGGGERAAPPGWPWPSSPASKGAGGRARRPGLGGLRPRSTSPPRRAQAPVPSASLVLGASPAGDSHRVSFGIQEDPRLGTSPESQRLGADWCAQSSPFPAGLGAAGTQPAGVAWCVRAPKPKPRQLLQSSEEKRRSAAARGGGGGGGGGGRRRPLAEQALPAPPPPAPTLRVRWDSAPPRQAPAPRHSVHGVCTWPAIAGLAFQILNPQPGSCSSCVQATSACG